MPRKSTVSQFNSWQQMPNCGMMNYQNQNYYMYGGGANQMNMGMMMNQQASFHSYNHNQSSMTTLSPQLMCTLQREYPEAYMLIQQQRHLIHQQRIQLDGASKEVSKLRRALKEQTAESCHDERKCDSNEYEEAKEAVKDCREENPTAISVIETNPRSQTPSSPLTDTSSTQSSSQPPQPLKKRIIEAAKDDASCRQHDNKENYDEKEDFHPTKKFRSTLPDLARVAATLSAATSPLHKEEDPSNMIKKKSPRPDVATVAATPAAATSPVFRDIGSRMTGRCPTNNSTFAF